MGDIYGLGLELDPNGPDDPNKAGHKTITNWKWSRQSQANQLGTVLEAGPTLSVSKGDQLYLALVEAGSQFDATSVIQINFAARAGSSVPTPFNTGVDTALRRGVSTQNGRGLGVTARSNWPVAGLNRGQPYPKGIQIALGTPSCPGSFYFTVDVDGQEQYYMDPDMDVEP